MKRYKNYFIYLIAILTFCQIKYQPIYASDDKCNKQYMFAAGLYEKGNFELAIEQFQRFLTDCGGDEIAPEAQYWIGESYYNLERYDEAIQAYTQTVTKYPTNKISSSAQSRIGNCYYLVKKYDQALVSYQKLMDDYPSSEEVQNAMYWTAWCYFKSSDFENAAKTFNRFIKNYPASQLNIEAVFMLAESLFNMQKYEPAIEVYGKIANLPQPQEPYNLNAYYGLGWSYYALKKFDSSIVYFKKITVNYPQSDQKVESQYKIGENYYLKGVYNDSLNEFNKFISSYPDSEFIPSAKYYVAESYFQLEKYDSALINYKNVLDNNPSIDIADNLQYSIAWCYYKRTDIENAFKNFQAVVEKFPQSKYIVDSYYRLGEITYNKGEFPAAIENFTKFVKAAPDNPNAADAYYWIGWSYSQLKDCANTVKAFEKIQQNYPKSSHIKDIQFMLAECYYNLEKYDKSRELYSKMIESNDSTYLADSLYSISWVYFKQNNEEKAIEYSQELVKKFPNSKHAKDSHFKLGEYYYKNQNYPKAIESFKEVTNDKSLYFQNVKILDSTQSTPSNPVYMTIKQLNPQVAFAQLLIADCFYNIKDMDSAIKEYKYFMDNFPDDERMPKVLKSLALIYVQQKNYKAAIEVYNILIKKNIDQKLADEVHYHLGEAYYSIKVFDSAILQYEQVRTGDYSDDALYGSAWSNLKKKDYKASISDFQDLLSKYPDTQYAPEAEFRVGEIYYMLNQYDSALTSYKKNLEKHPESEYSDDALYWTGWTNLKSNNFTQSLESFNKLIEKFPKSEFIEDAYFRRAFSYMSLKRYSDAIEKFQDFLNKFPQSKLSEDAIYGLAQSYNEKGALGEAETGLSSLLNNDELNPDTKIQIEYILGLSAFNREAYAKCVEYYEAFLTKHPDHDKSKAVLFKLAQAYYNQKNYEKAISKFTEYRSKFPGGEDYENTIYWTGLAYLQLKKYDNTREEWENIITNPNSKLRPDVEYQLAEILYTEGKYDQALSKYKEVIEKYHGTKAYDAAKYSIGWAYVQLKNIPSAVDGFKDIITNYPNSEYWSLSFYKFIELESENGKDDEVVAAYQKHNERLTKDETYFNAMSRVGASYYNLKKFNEAIKIYEQIINSKFDNLKPRTLLSQGNIYTEQSNWADARAKFDVIVKTYPNAPECDEAMYNISVAWIKENKLKEAIDSIQLLVSKKSEYQDKALLLLGIANFQNKNYTDSISAFRKLIEDLQNSKLVGEAQFRIGEALLEDKKIKDAKVEYLKMDILYSSSEYADDALFRLGEIFEIENDNAKARESYNTLITKYPQSDLIEKAKEKLGKLK